MGTRMFALIPGPLRLPRRAQWTDETIDCMAMEQFPTINQEEALMPHPILQLDVEQSKNCMPIGREQLREYTKARLRVFYEEELDVPLVLFNDVLDHVLRIDRVFRQIQGHMLLIGVSGSGKVRVIRICSHSMLTNPFRPRSRALSLG